MNRPKHTHEEIVAIIRAYPEHERRDLGKLLESPLCVPSVGRFRRTETEEAVHSIVRRWPSPSTSGKTLGPVALVLAAHRVALESTGKKEREDPSVTEFQIAAARKMAALMNESRRMVSQPQAVGNLPTVVVSVSTPDGTFFGDTLKATRSMAAYFRDVAEGDCGVVDTVLVSVMFWLSVTTAVWTFVHLQ
jgi:hypothetical protein